MTSDRNHNDQASPATIEKHLSGMNYPAGKDELVQHAKGQDAPDDVISVLDRMPDRQYGSAADVAKGIGKAE